MINPQNDIVDFAREVLGVKLYPKQAAALREYYASERPNWLLLSGRRGGKSLLSDIVACYESCVPDFSEYLRPGETRYILILSVRLESARLHIRNIAKMLKHTRSIGRLILRETNDSLELSNNVIILSLPASGRAGRGYTASLVVYDELAHFVDSNGNASADSVFDAFSPTVATFDQAARQVITTTPMARQGIVFDLFDRALEDWHITQATSQELNPKVSDRTIKSALARDEESARTEYFAEFRDPCENFLNADKVMAAVDPHLKRQEQAAPGVSYVMAIDPATLADRYAFVIGHKDTGRVILDYARIMKPPVNPNDAEALLGDLVEKFKPTKIRCDTASTVERLKSKFYQLQYDPFSRPLKLKIYGALKEALNLDRLVLYRDDDLLNELKALQIRNGVDIAAPKSGRVTHDDLSDCLALVCEALIGHDNSVTVYEGNPFYSDDLEPENWVWQRVGSRMIKVGKDTVDAHPLTAEAVLKCKRRATGCGTCITYYEQSGEYAAQDAEAAARKQEGHSDPDPDRDRRRWLPSEPADNYRAFLQKFNLKG